MMKSWPKFSLWKFCSYFVDMMHKHKSNQEILELLDKKQIAPYELEKILDDDLRAVNLR